MGFSSKAGGFDSNRREFLKGALATAGALSLESKAARAETFELSPRQKEIRNRGIQEMQASATTTDHEIARYFVAESSGRATWHKIRIKQIGFQAQGIGAGIAAEIDDRDLEDMVALAQKGARVESVHTHPTRMGKDAQLTGSDRVPPSPTDMISAIRLTKDAGAQGAPYMSFSAVTESGVWNYGPSSPTTIEKISEALNAPLPHLKELEKNKEGGREVANFLKLMAEESKVSIPPKMIHLFETGKVIQYIEEHPEALNRLQPFVSLLEKQTKSPDAKRYAQTVVEAEKTLVTALQTIDPKNDGLIGMEPRGGEDTAYKKRWIGLGMKMDFIPNQT